MEPVEVTFHQNNNLKKKISALKKKLLIDFRKNTSPEKLYKIPQKYIRHTMHYNLTQTNAH